MFQLFGQAKVQNLRSSVLGDEDVARLDIAMDDAVGMGCSEGVGNVSADRENALHRQRLASDQMVQRATLNWFEPDAIQKLLDRGGLQRLLKD